MSTRLNLVGGKASDTFNISGADMSSTQCIIASHNGTICHQWRIIDTIDCIVEQIDTKVCKTSCFVDVPPKKNNWCILLLQYLFIFSLNRWKHVSTQSQKTLQIGIDPAYIRRKRADPGLKVCGLWNGLWSMQLCFRHTLSHFLFDFVACDLRADKSQPIKASVFVTSMSSTILPV